MAFLPAQATDRSWSAAEARAVESSPAAVAFAVLPSEAADPAVEFAPFAVDVAVECVDAAEAAFDDDPDAVDVAREASTAVAAACDPFPGADAFAVESWAPELAPAPVGLPTSDVAVLRPVAAAVAGPPVVVDVAEDGVVGMSVVPPVAWDRLRVAPSGVVPTDVDPGIGPAEAPATTGSSSPVPALEDVAASEPGAAAAAADAEAGRTNSGSDPIGAAPAPAPAPLRLELPEADALSGDVSVDVVALGALGAFGGSAGSAGSGGPLAAAAAAAEAPAGVVAVAGV